MNYRVSEAPTHPTHPSFPSLPFPAAGVLGGIRCPKLDPIKPRLSGATRERPRPAPSSRPNPPDPFSISMKSPISFPIFFPPPASPGAFPCSEITWNLCLPGRDPWRSRSPRRAKTPLAAGTGHLGKPGIFETLYIEPTLVLTQCEEPTLKIEMLLKMFNLVRQISKNLCKTI